MAKRDSSTFVFPETAFTTVTAYQNQQVRFLYELQHGIPVKQQGTSHVYYHLTM